MQPNYYSAHCFLLSMEKIIIIQERKNYTFLSCWHKKINQSIMADHSLYMDMILNKRYNNTE